jgi:hypothetical protein
MTQKITIRIVTATKTSHFYTIQNISIALLNTPLIIMTRGTKISWAIQVALTGIVYNFSRKLKGKKTNLEEVGVYGRVMALLDIKLDDVGCIQLCQDKPQYQAAENILQMELQKCGYFFKGWSIIRLLMTPIHGVE